MTSRRLDNTYILIYIIVRLGESVMGVAEGYPIFFLFFGCLFSGFCFVRLCFGGEFGTALRDFFSEAFKDEGLQYTFAHVTEFDDALFLGFARFGFSRFPMVDGQMADAEEFGELRLGNTDLLAPFDDAF